MTTGITAGALINPVGVRLATFPLSLLSRRDALADVREWNPPSFERPTEWLLIGLLILLVVAARRGIGWARLLPALGFVIGGFLAIRNLTSASLVVVAMTAPALDGAYGTVDGRLRGRLPSLLGVGTMAGLLLFAGLVAAGPGVDTSTYPVEEVDLLEDRGLVANPNVVLVHREAVGNYLGFRYGDRASVFFDDRFDMYPLELITDHRRLVLGGDFEEVLTRRSADVVLWQADTPMGRWLERAGAWDLTVAGDEWLIACRIDSAFYDRCHGQ